MSKHEITKEEFEQAFLENPDVRYIDFQERFKIGWKVISRELKRHGLSTKPLSEREKPWLQGGNNPLSKWHRDNPDFGDKQKGAANPIHKVMHLYDDPNYVSNLTKGIRKHVEFKTGKPYEEVYGEEKANEYKEKLRKATPSRMAKYMRKRTSLEVRVAAMLSELEVNFQSEVGMGFYVVDFLLPDFGVVIQADGDYWHANPEVYSDLTDRQKERRRLDKSCDALVEGMGYRVLRLWEKDTKTRPKWCKDEIKKVLHGKED